MCLTLWVKVKNTPVYQLQHLCHDCKRRTSGLTASVITDFMPQWWKLGKVWGRTMPVLIGDTKPFTSLFYWNIIFIAFLTALQNMNLAKFANSWRVLLLLREEIHQVFTKNLFFIRKHLGKYILALYCPLIEYPALIVSCKIVYCVLKSIIIEIILFQIPLMEVCCVIYFFLVLKCTPWNWH